ncbi:hypothetical protein Pan3_44 [Pseudanabaena phage Pan3]|nr:hypothetical protein Pan3_44 [Pseudanabaena phage Pan3]
MTHTPEPWRVEEGTTLIWGACNPDDRTTYGMGYDIAQCRITPSLLKGRAPWVDEGKANARRIVAAINATAGIPTEALEAGVVRELVEAARELLAAKASTYKARNGRDVGIEADDGEMCWIVHSDQIFRLEMALAKAGAA